MLGVGLQAGMISQRLYSAMVIAVVTTAMASPLLSVLMRTGDSTQASPGVLVGLGPAWGDSSGL